MTESHYMSTKFAALTPGHKSETLAAETRVKLRIQEASCNYNPQLKFYTNTSWPTSCNNREHTDLIWEHKEWDLRERFSHFWVKFPLGSLAKFATYNFSIIPLSLGALLSALLTGFTWGVNFPCMREKSKYCLTYNTWDLNLQIAIVKSINLKLYNVHTYQPLIFLNFH